MIRVLVVDDSPLVAKFIVNILNMDPEILVVGIAGDGHEAVRLVPKLEPDLITTDMHMPGMGGEEATKKIMAYSPTPILIISSSIFVKGMDKVFTAMSYGALDLIDKRLLFERQDDGEAKNELLLKVKTLTKIKKYPFLNRKAPRLLPLSAKTLETAQLTAQEKVVGLVASTGGPQALAEILQSLPRNFPAPIVVVQHISSGFDKGFADWLNEVIPMKAKIAQNLEELKPSTVYIAPSSIHMRVNENAKIDLLAGSPVDGHCPSGTVLFKSLAKAYGARALGVVLTGMGHDGALGIKALHDAQGYTIAQDEKTSIIHGMPKEAFDMGAINEVLALNAIAPRILTWTLE